MTIRKKIESSKDEAMEFIAEGGQVKKDKIKDSDSNTICVRIPSEFFHIMDKTVKKRIGLSRNAWILEAMQEKVFRDV